MNRPSPAVVHPHPRFVARLSRPAFVSLRGESTVAALVTFAVAGWFLVAAGAILTDPVSPYTTRVVQVHRFPTMVVVPSQASAEPRPATAREARAAGVPEAQRG